MGDRVCSSNGVPKILVGFVDGEGIPCAYLDTDISLGGVDRLKWPLYLLDQVLDDSWLER